MKKYQNKIIVLYVYICVCKCIVCFQIKQESFLEDINNLLNAGEVPNLYPLDEKQEICEKMRQLDR